MEKKTFTIEVEFPFTEGFLYRIIDLKGELTLKIAEHALLMTGNNKTQAAKLLRMDRTNFIRLVRTLRGTQVQPK